MSTRILPVVEPDPYLSELGTRIRELRSAANLNQEELAAASGISAKYLSQLENGRVNPSVSVIRAIAEDGLGMQLPALFNFDLDHSEATAISNDVVALLSAQPKKVRRKWVAALRAYCSVL